MLIQVEQLNLVFGLFGLAKTKNQPNFGIQWRKGGDFLRGFLKKYYLTIVWRKTYLIIEESKLNEKAGQTHIYQGFMEFSALNFS
ncbi:hypothetical protein AT270_10320 [Bacillus cereus]|nr:hypothetical protein AT270_10320 [Bacillus cereus]